MLTKAADKLKKINIYQIALTFFVLCLLLVNIRWLKLNTQIPSYDPSWYLENSQVMYHSLTERGLAGFWQAYTNAFRIKAPLISVLPIPFYLIFGNTLKVSYLPNLLFLIVFNIYLFRLVNLLTKNKNTALLACFFTSTFPLVVAASREIMVEYFTMTLAVVFLYYLFLNRDFQSRKYNIILGLLLGIGLLFKVLFPLYIALPAFYVLYLALKEKKDFRDKKIWRSVGLILLVGLALAATWYWKNILYIGYFVWQASFGVLAKDYVISGTFFEQIKAFKLLFINYGLSVYYTALLVLSAIPFLVKKIKDKQEIFTFCAKGASASGGNFWFLLFWFLPIIFFFIGVNKTLRFLTPFLPVLGIVLAIFVVKILPKKFKILSSVACLLLFFPVYSLLYSSFHSVPGKDLKIGPFVITQKYGHTVFPPQDEVWPIPEIVDFIYKDNIWNEKHTLILIVPSLPEFNHNNFSYLAMQKNYKNLDFGGFPRDTVINAISRMRDADYLIDKSDSPSLPGFNNKFNAEIQKTLEEGKFGYKKIKVFALPDQTEAFIYKKL